MTKYFFYFLWLWESHALFILVLISIIWLQVFNLHTAETCSNILVSRTLFDDLNHWEPSQTFCDRVFCLEFSTDLSVLAVLNYFMKLKVTKEETKNLSVMILMISQVECVVNCYEAILHYKSIICFTPKQTIFKRLVPVFDKSAGMSPVWRLFSWKIGTLREWREGGN